MNNVITQNINKNILKITLNNPIAQNTLSLDVINYLKKIFTEADNSNEIKVIVISSIGKVFCAGHNLKEINIHRNDSDKGLSFFTKLIIVDSKPTFELPSFNINLIFFPNSSLTSSAETGLIFVEMFALGAASG